MRGTRPSAGALPRKRVLLRERIARESDAPRYVGWAYFSKLTGFDSRHLSYWLRAGTVWVPTPTVLLGEQGRPGWEPEILRAWEPGLTGVERSEPVRYLSGCQLRRRYGMSDDLLWICVAEDRTLPMPAIWLDGKPGWADPIETPGQKAGSPDIGGSAQMAQTLQDPGPDGPAGDLWNKDPREDRGDYVSIHGKVRNPHGTF